MRLAAVSLLGVSCLAACADKQALPPLPPLSPLPPLVARHEPCDPFTTVDVRHRTEGGFVHLEMVRSHMDCDGPGAEDITPVARIALSSASARCPIGQLALRMWNSGRNVDKMLPDFVSKLDRESLAEVSDTLRGLGDRANAFVVACPDGAHADWLLVETYPRNFMPRVELFVRNRLSPKRQHPQVTFSPSGARGSPAP